MGLNRADQVNFGAGRSLSADSPPFWVATR